MTKKNPIFFKKLVLKKNGLVKAFHIPPISKQFIIHSIAISPNDDQIIIGMRNGDIYVWELSSGKILNVLKGHEKPVHSIVFTPDGKFIITSSQDNTIKIWDSSFGKLVRVLQEKWVELGAEWHRDVRGFARSISTIIISPNGLYVLEGSGSLVEGKIVIWRLSSGKPLRTLDGGDRNWVQSISVSSDNKYIVSSSYDYDINIFEFSSGKHIRMIDGGSNILYPVRITLNSKSIISGASDGNLYIWELSTGEQIQVLKGHKGEINSLAISTDGPYLASGSKDNSVRVWNITNNQNYGPFQHNSSVGHVVFVPKKDLLISVHNNGDILIWDFLHC